MLNTIFKMKNLSDFEKKVEEIREVLHFENGIEHKILITHVIAKVSYILLFIYVHTKGRLKTLNIENRRAVYTTG